LQHAGNAVAESRRAQRLDPIYKAELLNPALHWVHRRYGKVLKKLSIHDVGTILSHRLREALSLWLRPLGTATGVVCIVAELSEGKP
jgi:hypothetical protein